MNENPLCKAKLNVEHASLARRGAYERREESLMWGLGLSDCVFTGNFLPHGFHYFLYLAVAHFLGEKTIFALLTIVVPKITTKCVLLEHVILIFALSGESKLRIV